MAKDKEKDIETPEVEQDVEATAAEAATEATPEEKLAQELAKTKKELEKAKEDLLFLMSDFQNFRRAAAREKLDLLNTAAENTIVGMLPILDDIEIAVNAVNATGDKKSAEGLNLIHSKLLGYLKSKGLEIIPAKDEPFNTDLHEAVAQIPVQEEDRKGLVFDVTQQGYKLNGKVIRYAKVVVAI